MKIRIKGTVDAWFEWEADASDEERAVLMYGLALDDVGQLSATELRIVIGGGFANAPQSNDRTYSHLTESPEPTAATEGENMLWLARKSRGKIVYGDAA